MEKPVSPKPSIERERDIFARGQKGETLNGEEQKIYDRIREELIQDNRDERRDGLYGQGLPDRYKH